MANERRNDVGKHAAPSRRSSAKSSSAKKTATKTSSSSKKRKAARRTGILVAVLAIAFAAIAAAAAGVYYVYFYNKVYPGVKVEGKSYAGMTQKEVLADLNERFGSQSPASGKLTVHVGDASYDIAFSKDAATYDLVSTAREVYNQGRTGNLSSRIKELAALKKQGKELELAIKVNSDVIRTQAEDIAADMNKETVKSSYVIGDTEITVDKGATGVKVDASALLAYINDKFSRGDFSDGEFKVDLTEPAAINIDAIHDAVTVEMQEPYYDYENDPTCQTVVEGVQGVTFDLDAAKQALADPDQRKVTIPLIFTQPTHTAAELKAALFRDKLSSVTTSFNANLIGRTNNVKLAGDFVNGTIVMPGEEFSYNKTVGERTEARGFQYGTIYANGSTEDGIGGGICQTSSTIYSACLRADMLITERHNHSRVVTYVPLGEDATVSWGSLDYRFINNTEYPIKLVITYTHDTITCTILGTQTVSGKRVVIEDNTLSTNPFEVVYKLDTTLERGTQKVKNNGFSGAVVETYRLVYINGELISRTYEGKSIYYRLDKVILYNPWVEGGGPDDPKPEDPTTTTTTVTDPTQTDPTQTEPSQTEPSQTQPSQTEPSQTETTTTAEDVPPAPTQTEAD